MTFVGDWNVELPQIVVAAGDYNLDHLFIAAIRHTENGGPGREFGVLSVVSNTYYLQLHECCVSVAHRLEQYHLNPMMRYYQGALLRQTRMGYTGPFILWFASIWAPGGASNDPRGLNANWFKNCDTTYQAFIQNGVK